MSISLCESRLRRLTQFPHRSSGARRQSSETTHATETNRPHTCPKKLRAHEDTSAGLIGARALGGELTRQTIEHNGRGIVPSVGAGTFSSPLLFSMMNMLTLLSFVGTFLASAAAGAWLNGLTNGCGVLRSPAGGVLRSPIAGEPSRPASQNSTVLHLMAAGPRYYHRGRAPGVGDAPEGEDHELDRSYCCRNLRWHGSYGLSDSRNVSASRRFRPIGGAPEFPPSPGPSRRADNSVASPRRRTARRSRPLSRRPETTLRAFHSSRAMTPSSSMTCSLQASRSIATLAAWST